MRLHQSPITTRAAIRRIVLCCLFILCGLIVVTTVDMVQKTATAQTPAVDRQPTPSTSVHYNVFSSHEGNADRAVGFGAGALGASPQVVNSQLVPQDCSIWTAPLCWVQNAITTIAQNIAGGILSFLQNIVGSVNSNAGADDFVTQTPLCLSNVLGCDPSPPLDQTLLTFLGWGQTVVSAALAFIIIIGGFNLMLGRQMGTSVHDLSEFIPRVVLTFLAAIVSPLIMQAFISLNNVLCQGVMSLFTFTALTNILVNLLSTGFSDGWIIFLFLVVVGIMLLLLIGQMLARLAFAAFLSALGPLGLLCFALPQTLFWGRLWLRQFSLTIFVQFLQIAMLCLGGALLSDIVKLASPLFANVNDAQVMLEAMLATALLWLTLRLPGMVREWAMRGVSDRAGQAATGAVSGAASYVADVAPELLALL